jgi:hypothetical protein
MVILFIIQVNKSSIIDLTKKMLRKNRVKFLTELFLNQFTPGAAQDT